MRRLRKEAAPDSCIYRQALARIVYSMGYRIHLAESREAAAEEEPDLQIDYHVHRQIFEEADLWDLTLFYHLSDFYQDAIFEGDNVLSLRDDVEKARKRIHDPRSTMVLSMLSKVCQRAIKRGWSVYGFGE